MTPKHQKEIVSSTTATSQPQNQHFLLTASGVVQDGSTNSTSLTTTDDDNKSPDNATLEKLQQQQQKQPAVKSGIGNSTVPTTNSHHQQQQNQKPQNYEILPSFASKYQQCHITQRYNAILYELFYQKEDLELQQQQQQRKLQQQQHHVRKRHADGNDQLGECRRHDRGKLEQEHPHKRSSTQQPQKHHFTTNTAPNYGIKQEGYHGINDGVGSTDANRNDNLESNHILNRATAADALQGTTTQSDVIMPTSSTATKIVTKSQNHHHIQEASSSANASSFLPPPLSIINLFPRLNVGNLKNLLLTDASSSRDEAQHLDADESSLLVYPYNEASHQSEHFFTNAAHFQFQVREDRMVNMHGSSSSPSDSNKKTKHSDSKKLPYARYQSHWELKPRIRYNIGGKKECLHYIIDNNQQQPSSPSSPTESAANSKTQKSLQNIRDVYLLLRHKGVYWIDIMIRERREYFNHEESTLSATNSKHTQKPKQPHQSTHYNTTSTFRSNYKTGNHFSVHKHSLGSKNQINNTISVAAQARSQSRHPNSDSGGRVKYSSWKVAYSYWFYNDTPSFQYDLKLNSSIFQHTLMCRDNRYQVLSPLQNVLPKRKVVMFRIKLDRSRFSHPCVLMEPQYFVTKRLIALRKMKKSKARTFLTEYPKPFIEQKKSKEKRKYKKKRSRYQLFESPVLLDLFVPNPQSNSREPRARLVVFDREDQGCNFPITVAEYIVRDKIPTLQPITENDVELPNLWKDSPHGSSSSPGVVETKNDLVSIQHEIQSKPYEKAKQFALAHRQRNANFRAFHVDPNGSNTQQRGTIRKSQSQENSTHRRKQTTTLEGIYRRLMTPNGKTRVHFDFTSRLSFSKKGKPYISVAHGHSLSAAGAARSLARESQKEVARRAAAGEDLEFYCLPSLPVDSSSGHKPTTISLNSLPEKVSKKLAESAPSNNHRTAKNMTLLQGLLQKMQEIFDQDSASTEETLYNEDDRIPLNALHQIFSSSTYHQKQRSHGLLDVVHDATEDAEDDLQSLFQDIEDELRREGHLMAEHERMDIRKILRGEHGHMKLSNGSLDYAYNSSGNRYPTQSSDDGRARDMDSSTPSTVLQQESWNFPKEESIPSSLDHSSSSASFQSLISAKTQHLPEAFDDSTPHMSELSSRSSTLDAFSSQSDSASLYSSRDGSFYSSSEFSSHPTSAADVSPHDMEEESRNSLLELSEGLTLSTPNGEQINTHLTLGMEPIDLNQFDTNEDTIYTEDTDSSFGIASVAEQEEETHSEEEETSESLPSMEDATNEVQKAPTPSAQARRQKKPKRTNHSKKEGKKRKLHPQAKHASQNQLSHHEKTSLKKRVSFNSKSKKVSSIKKSKTHHTLLAKKKSKSQLAKSTEEKAKNDTGTSINLPKLTLSQQHETDPAMEQAEFDDSNPSSGHQATEEPATDSQSNHSQSSQKKTKPKRDPVPKLFFARTVKLKFGNHHASLSYLPRIIPLSATDVRQSLGLSAQQLLFLKIIGIEHPKKKITYKFVQEPGQPSSILEKDVLSQKVTYRVIVEDTREADISQLTEEERKFIKAKFHLIDRDGSGEISFDVAREFYTREENQKLDQQMQMLQGLLHSDPSREQEIEKRMEEAQAMCHQLIEQHVQSFIEADVDGSKTIDLEEFMLHEGRILLARR